MLTKYDIIHIFNNTKKIENDILKKIFHQSLFYKKYPNNIEKAVYMIIMIYNIKKYDITNINSFLYDYFYSNKKMKIKKKSLFRFNRKNKDIINFFTILNKGYRNYMEDNILIINKKKYYFSIVLDGHGGNECSLFIKTNFTNYFLKNLNKIKDNYKLIIKNTLKQLDSDFLKLNFKSGSTMNLLFIDKVKKKYYIFNVGDSRCICFTKTKEIKQISIDHRPNVLSEKIYIEQIRYGFVKNNRVNGILGVSRAFGDKKLKKYITSTPDIFEGKFDNILYFIQGTDGVFDYIKNNELIQLINKKNLYYNKNIENAYKFILYKKKSKDNISISFTLIS